MRRNCSRSRTRRGVLDVCEYCGCSTDETTATVAEQRLDDERRELEERRVEIERRLSELDELETAKA